MTSSEEIYEAFDDLGYLLEDSDIIDKLCSLCDEYGVDETKMSVEYLSFASKKKYKEPTLEILEQFEVEVWIGQESRPIVETNDPEYN